MDFVDWIELICSVGSFIFAVIDYFNNHK